LPWPVIPNFFLMWKTLVYEKLWWTATQSQATGINELSSTAVFCIKINNANNTAELHQFSPNDILWNFLFLLLQG
jgi:hypothetical protein